MGENCSAYPYWQEAPLPLEELKFAVSNPESLVGTFHLTELRYACIEAQLFLKGRACAGVLASPVDAKVTQAAIAILSLLMREVSYL
jgi:hypothetical protein